MGVADYIEQKRAAQDPTYTQPAYPGQVREEGGIVPGMSGEVTYKTPPYGQPTYGNPGYVVPYGWPGGVVPGGSKYDPPTPFTPVGYPYNQKLTYQQMLEGSKGPTGGSYNPSGGTGSLEDILRGINPNDWQNGLKAAEGDLGRYGVTLQKDSAGNIRGRLYGNQWGGGFYDPFNQYGWNTTNTGGAGGGGGGGFGGGGGSFNSNSYNDLINTLTHRAGQSLNVSGKDPLIASQVNSYRASQMRDARDYVDRIAEQKGPNANIQGERRLMAEKGAQNVGQLQSQLMWNELGARRQEISQALSLWGNLLSDQQRLSLQKELAYLSNDQFLRQLGLQAEESAAKWDWLRSGGASS